MISNKIDYDNHDSGVYGKGGNNIPSYDIDQSQIKDKENPDSDSGSSTNAKKIDVNSDGSYDTLNSASITTQQTSVSNNTITVSDNK